MQFLKRIFMTPEERDHNDAIKAERAARKQAWDAKCEVTRSAVSERLKNTSEQARAFALGTLDDVMLAVGDRRVNHAGAWWFDIKSRNGDMGPALVAFQKIPEVAAFLNEHGIQLTPHRDDPEYQIGGNGSPPVGSYGEMMSNAFRAHKIKIIAEYEKWVESISLRSEPTHENKQLARDLGDDPDMRSGW